jgi:phage terminase large subunit
MQFLFRPKRYKVLYGGRGSAKSWSVARALLYLATKKKLRILCARETQTSITESVHRLLRDQIEAMGLSKLFDIQRALIRCRNGSEFTFVGIKTDPAKLKSTEGVDICWVEEAEKVSEQSWAILIPTIRKAGSEIWITFNPDQETDPTAKRFLLNPPPDAKVVAVSWANNPWLPAELRKEKDYLYRVDPEAAAHIWGGQFRKGSQAQIFRGRYVVEEFEAEETGPDGRMYPKLGFTGPYFGADWGFSSDPDTLVKLWRDQTKLYVEYEAYGVGIQLNEIPQLWDTIPGAREHIIRADNSRPETIYHVASLGFNVMPADKWPGSVEDGITWLKHHEQIVIHPRCKRTEEEARLYRYKTDPVTGDVLPIILDKHNHCWDAIRYAMQPAIRVPEQEEIYVHEEPVSISPDLDQFEMKYMDEYPPWMDDYPSW